MTEMTEMTWTCSGCDTKLKLMDIAVIGPGTLKWCKSCKDKPRLLSSNLNKMVNENTITVKVTLQMTKDRSERASRAVE